MKKILFLLFSVYALITLDSCRNTASAQESFFSRHSSLTLIEHVEDGDVLSLVSGEIVTLPPEILKEANFGTYAAVKAKTSFQFNGREENAEFTVITGNMTKVTKKKGAVEKGSLLGISKKKQSFTLIMAETRNSYLVCSAAEPAEKDFGKWWFSADFLLENPHDLWINYNPSPSPSDALETMLSGGKNNRFRIPLILSAYPRRIDADTAEEISAYDETRTGTEEAQSMTAFTEAGKSYTVFWGEGTVRFLQTEYNPGKPLWILATVIPSDINPGMIFIFVKEFMLESLESFYDDRLNGTTRNDPDTFFGRS